VLVEKTRPCRAHGVVGFPGSPGPLERKRVAGGNAGRPARAGLEGPLAFCYRTDRSFMGRAGSNRARRRHEERGRDGVRV